MVVSKPKWEYVSFCFVVFYMVELKLSYRSSHLKRYKVKQLRKMFKKESKESKVLFIEQYPLDNVCATKQGTTIDGPCPLGPKEIYGLLMPPGKSYSLLII